GGPVGAGAARTLPDRGSGRAPRGDRDPAPGPRVEREHGARIPRGGSLLARAGRGLRPAPLPPPRPELALARDAGPGRAVAGGAPRRVRPPAQPGQPDRAPAAPRDRDRHLGPRDPPRARGRPPRAAGREQPGERGP